METIISRPFVVERVAFILRHSRRPFFVRCLSPPGTTKNKTVTTDRSRHSGGSKSQPKRVLGIAILISPTWCYADLTIPIQFEGKTLTPTVNRFHGHIRRVARRPRARNHEKRATNTKSTRAAGWVVGFHASMSRPAVLRPTSVIPTARKQDLGCRQLCRPGKTKRNRGWVAWASRSTRFWARPSDIERRPGPIQQTSGKSNPVSGTPRRCTPPVAFPSRRFTLQVLVARF